MSSETSFSIIEPNVTKRSPLKIVTNHFQTIELNFQRDQNEKSPFQSNSLKNQTQRLKLSQEKENQSCNI